MAEWSFPGNANGQIRGYSDAGIETFNGNELKSLAREMCQNSLDACATGKKMVRIEFEQYSIKTDDIPGYSEYKDVIEKCKTYWDSQKSNKAHRFLQEAQRKIHDENSSVLRISDYNTTGLADPFGESFEGWNSLTKIDGGSTKEGNLAGSYGIGKNAPFSNSYYRLVFYRTLNGDNEIAAQGMSRLLSFPTDLSKAFDTMTVGIGYYGNPGKNKPVKRIKELDAIKERDAQGTDVFIYGFKGYKWEDELIPEILDNFLMALFNQKLEVSVQNIHIDAGNLGNMVNRYAQSAKDAFCDYRVLTDEENVKTFERNFHGLGILKLHILIDPTSKLNKRVLVVRKTGMKLFQMAGISRAISFSGILELQGEKLNEFFSQMETISHDSWEPSRHSDPIMAKKYFEELKNWVRETVMDLGENTSDEEINVEGLSGILQDDEVEERNSEPEEKKESLNNHLGSIEVVERHENSVVQGMFYSSEEGDLTSDDTKDVPGTINAGGHSSTTRVLKGSRKRATKERHFGDPDEEGEDITHEKVRLSGPVDLKNTRIMKTNNPWYRMIFEVPYTVLKGHVCLLTIGENGKRNKLFINEVGDVSGCSVLSLKNGEIIFKNMTSESKIRIEFALRDSREFALGVDVYEDN